MCTVYIIDDEKQTADMLGEFVSLMGHEAYVYTEATQFFSENSIFPPCSVLILDLNMPDMDGVEVMRHLAEIHRLIPLILISGYDKGVLHSAEQ
jgi:FixJ family two-component response regulator